MFREIASFHFAIVKTRAKGDCLMRKHVTAKFKAPHKPRTPEAPGDPLKSVRYVHSENILFAWRAGMKK